MKKKKKSFKTQARLSLISILGKNPGQIKIIPQTNLSFWYAIQKGLFGENS